MDGRIESVETEIIVGDAVFLRSLPDGMRHGLGVVEHFTQGGDAMVAWASGNCTITPPSKLRKRADLDEELKRAD